MYLSNSTYQRFLGSSLMLFTVLSEGDPHNYLTYFKRGTVYYALGKAKFALQDFTKVTPIESLIKLKRII